MTLSASFQQMRDEFEAQFEVVDDDRYLYRRNLKGEPIPVTAEERERFIRQYLWRVRFTLAGMMAALLAFWGLVLWWALAGGHDLPKVAMYAGTIVIAAGGIVLMYWVRAAPARQLSRRSAVGRERSPHEMRVIFFGKIRYGQLAVAAVAGVALVASRAFKENLLSGWGRLWLVFGAGIVLIAGVQAFRKWRFESTHPDDTTH